MIPSAPSRCGLLSGHPLPRAADRGAPLSLRAEGRSPRHSLETPRHASPVPRSAPFFPRMAPSGAALASPIASFCLSLARSRCLPRSCSCHLRAAAAAVTPWPRPCDRTLRAWGDRAETGSRDGGLFACGIADLFLVLSSHAGGQKNTRAATVSPMWGNRVVRPGPTPG
jgi:hypothetical protein